MIQFTDISDALSKISAFLIETYFSDEAVSMALRNAAASVSPVDRIVGFGKTVHEHRETLDDDTKAIGVAALSFASQFGWHGMSSEAAPMIAELLPKT